MTIATQIQGVVVAWQLYAITHDPLVLGLIGLAEALPFIATALYPRYMSPTDRPPYHRARRRVMVACAGALLAFSLLVTGDGGSALFYLVIGVSGVARSFLMPARTALAAELVPREHVRQRHRLAHLELAVRCGGRPGRVGGLAVRLRRPHPAPTGPT